MINDPHNVFPQAFAFDSEGNTIHYGTQAIIQCAMDYGLVKEEGAFMVLSEDDFLLSLARLSNEYPNHQLLSCFMDNTLVPLPSLYKLYKSETEAGYYQP